MANSNISPLTIDRTFTVSAERLYNAWTSEEELKKWWRPMEDELESVQADMREGGEIAYHFAGDKFSVAGKYEKVEQGKHLVYSWNWSFTDKNVSSENFTLNIRFDEQGDGSSLHILQQGFTSEEEKSTHEKGWNIGLQQLEDHLAGR